MFNRTQYVVLLAVLGGLTFFGPSPQASAQVPVTVYYPLQPTVGYMPVRAGLFGWRTAYRPVVIYSAPAVSTPVTTYYAPSISAPATTCCAPAAPLSNVTEAPVTAYYAPAVSPVTTYYAPSYAPMPVTTYYAPIIGW